MKGNVMADLVVGRAVWLSGYGRPQSASPRKPGRGNVTCQKCGAWAWEIVTGSFTKCHKCGADCSDETDQWDDVVD